MVIQQRFAQRPGKWQSVAIAEGVVYATPYVYRGQRFKAVNFIHAPSADGFSVGVLE
jgi:hypothetical protein